MHVRHDRPRRLGIGALMALGSLLAPVTAAGAGPDAPARGAAGPEIVAIELQPLDGAASAVPFDVNDDGVVVGTSGQEWGEGVVDGRATVWRDGEVSELPPAPPSGPADYSDTSIARHVNDRGDIVVTRSVSTNEPHYAGYVRTGGRDRRIDPSGHAQALNERGELLLRDVYPLTQPVSGPDVGLWRDGTTAILERPPAGAPQGVRGHDLSEAGHVVGTTYGGSVVPGFGLGLLWNDRVPVVLGVGADPLAVNRTGDIASSTAYFGGLLWRGGRLVSLGALVPVDLNDRGQLVGYVPSDRSPDGQAHAYLWDDGQVVDLGSLGDGDTYPSAVNERGQVVGISGGRHFLWSDGRMFDLGLAVGHVPVAGGRAHAGRLALNDEGQVAGITRDHPDGPLKAMLWELTGNS